MANRYTSEIIENSRLKRYEQMFTYSRPDPIRVQEHEKINEVFLEAVRAVARICPNNDAAELAVQQLWLARAAANGSLATYQDFNEPSSD